MPDAVAPPAAPSPPARPGHDRRRVLAVATSVLFVLAGAALTLQSDTPIRRQARATTTTSTVPQVVHFTVTGIDANGTAPPDQLVIDAVVAQLDGWALRGIVAPLRAGGGPTPDAAELFTAAGHASLAGPDGASVFIAGVPASRVTITAATATLHSVAGPDAGTAVVVATVDLQLVAEGSGHRVTVVRQGEFALVPEADGVWRIDGWKLHAVEESQ